MHNGVVWLISISIFISAVSIFVSVVVGPRNASPTQYFDLSYPFDKDTIYFPGQRQYELYMDYAKVERAGFIYSAYSFCMGEHGGTHLDATIHFNENGWTVDQIPMAYLTDVPAVVIDVENDVNALKEPGAFVFEMKHIIAYEKLHGAIPFGSVVLLHTGWSKYWPNKDKYLGRDNSTKSGETLNFPGFSENAVDMLIKQRRIIAVGLDTSSVDPGVSKTFPTHVLLAKEQIFSLENVANLGAFIGKTGGNCAIRLFILPLNIVGGTGAPARILAYCK